MRTEDAERALTSAQLVEACVAANQDKDDPAAYCGSIKNKVEKARESVIHREGAKTAEYDWDSNPQGRDREYYFCAECGVEGTYENQLRLLPSGRRVCRNCEVYRGVKAKRKKAEALPTGPYRGQRGKRER